METSKERKNQLVGMATSVGIHAIILLLFIFLMAWKAPNPPAPVYGIEVNFGVTDEGQGTEQPVSETGAEPSEQEPVQQDDPVTESPQEKQTETSSEPTTQAMSSEESPVAVKEDKKEEPTKKVVEEKKTITQPADKTAPEKKEQKTEVTTKSDIKTSEGSSKSKETANQGDDSKKSWDKGKPEGTLDPNAQYTGTPGGGGGGNGYALSMSGWEWADDPVIPELPDNEDGRIEFEIECDENGEIIGIKTLNRGLSIKAEQLLKEEIRKNSLIRTSSGKVPERSKGKVVFVLRTR
jgi:periplasmic protein TonB